MLRKSPYIQENYDSFYTKEWDRSNSLLNSQESITQTLNFMQNLRLDHYENSPARVQKDGMTESKNFDHQRSYNQSQMKQSGGAMIDITSQVLKSQRFDEMSNNQQNNQHNKRSINYSAFDQTSSMLLQANQDIFQQKKNVIDSNTTVMKTLYQNNDQYFNPQSCTYCKQHYDQVLLKYKQAQTSSSTSQNGNSSTSSKGESQNKLDQFFVRKQKNCSSLSSQGAVPAMQQFNNFNQQRSGGGAVQQTLFKYVNQNSVSNMDNFNLQPLSETQTLFQQCKECNRTICFSCNKHCQRCENIICPFCTTIKYGQYEDITLCTQCVNYQ